MLRFSHIFLPFLVNQPKIRTQTQTQTDLQQEHKHKTSSRSSQIFLNQKIHIFSNHKTQIYKITTQT